MHLLDLVFGLTARGPRFFEDGWGDRDALERASPAALVQHPPAEVRPKLGPEVRALGGILREGAFESPESRLPSCARRARIRLLLPERGVRAVALHLAASGDQGFAIRLRFAAPLLARGIGALVLENPYYGARRPAAQVAHAVRSVADLHLLGAATLVEGRALLAWLRREGFERVGVTGYSMGGQMAAMVGAAVPFPAAVVPVAPTCSPASVLARGVLREVAAWRALQGPGEDREIARAALCAVLARFSVRSLPPPRLTAAAIVVGTRLDGVVPPDEMEAIASHWRCELRWLAAGHVWAVLRHRAAMRAAIADAFARLEAPAAGTSLRREAPVAAGVPRVQPAVARAHRKPRVERP